MLLLDVAAVGYEDADGILHVQGSFGKQIIRSVMLKYCESPVIFTTGDGKDTDCRCAADDMKSVDDSVHRGVGWW